MNINNCKLFNDIRGMMQFIPVHDKIIQQFISKSHKNVVRGIHTSPYGKWITCIQGSFIDYIINFETMTYIKYHLTYKDINHIYVPPNHGHCFLSLEDDSMMLYQLEGKFDIDKDKNYHYRCPYINLDIPEGDYILSDKDNNNPFYKPIDYVVFGSSGFLGQETIKVLKDKNYITLSTRLEEVDKIEKQLAFYKPKYVICAAGISGKPTVQWCEINKIETFTTNVTYQLTLIQICNRLNIHITLYLSGMIYKNNDSSILYNEEHEPNNKDFYYTKCRILLEKALECYDNVLGLRIMYPIAFNNHPKCFLNKMLERKDNAHNIQINTTIVPDLFPKIPLLIESNIKGIINFVNYGSISIDTLFQEYTKSIDNSFKYNLISYNSSIGLLDTTKLFSLIPILKTEDAIKMYIKRVLL